MEKIASGSTDSRCCVENDVIELFAFMSEHSSATCQMVAANAAASSLLWFVRRKGSICKDKGAIKPPELTCLGIPIDLSCKRHFPRQKRPRFIEREGFSRIPGNRSDHDVTSLERFNLFMAFEA